MTAHIEVEQQGDEKTEGQSDEDPFDLEIPKRNHPISTVGETIESVSTAGGSEEGSEMNELDCGSEGFGDWEILNV